MSPIGFDSLQAAVGGRLCRSATRSMFYRRLLGNPLIVWGVVLEIALILLIDYTSWGNLIFGTAPIPRQVWLFIQQREIDEPVPRI